MSQSPIQTVLLVEDNRGDARLLQEMFNEEASHASTLIHVESMSEAEKHLAAHDVDVVLLDLGLPDAQGLEALRRARTAAPRVPVVVLTGMDDESLAARALQEGAQDYLVKGRIVGGSDIETRGLLRALRYAVDRNVMEEALFESKERAEVTLNCIGDGVASTDLAGNITFLNLVAEKMTGWPLREAAGRPVAEILQILMPQRNPLPIRWQGHQQDRAIHLPSNSSWSAATDLKFREHRCSHSQQRRAGDRRGHRLPRRPRGRALALQVTIPRSMTS